MRRTLPTALAVSLLSLSAAAFARDYHPNTLPYSDAPPDLPTKVAISVLTDARVLLGDPSGTFRPYAELNRAEFMAIVMRLSPSDERVGQPCFPDVSPTAWYADAVCRGKAMGIVTGNALPGLTQDKWPFQPARAVQYEEAVKVLTKLYAVPTDTVQGGEWYEPYIHAANNLDIGISGLVPGDRIKRGEMARLVAAYLAYAEGELQVLRDAQQGIARSSESSEDTGTGSSVSSGSTSSVRSNRSASTSSRSRSSLSGSSVSSRSSTSAKSGSSVSWSKGYDQLQDTTIRSRFIMLGDVSPVLGSISLFSNTEPIDVTRVTVVLSSAVQSVDALLVYDGERRLLGRAQLDTSIAGGRQYVLNIPVGTLKLPKQQNVVLYIRGDMESENEGGASAQTLQVNSFVIEGTGEWSTNQYTQTFADTFPVFQTARAVITGVTNAGPATDTLVAGPNQQIGAFRFTGELADSQAALRLTELNFQVEGGSNITLSNVELHRSDTQDIAECTASAFTVTCSAIPQVIGRISGETVIRVFADVTFASNVDDAVLRLSLNQPGNVGTPGAISWTDGDATFTWVPFDAPVARSTNFQ